MAEGTLPPNAPTVDELRAWLGVPLSALSDEQFAEILLAESDMQQRLCRTGEDGDDLPSALVRSLYRRVGREVSARQLPLGTSGDAEFGTVRLPGYDAEIARLEASYRRDVVA